MNHRYPLQFFKAIFGLLFAMLLVFTQAGAQTVKTYNTPGTYTFTVPACVTSIAVMCWGGGGGGGWAGEPSSGATGSGGGGGGFAGGVLNNVSGNFTVTVGGAGIGGTGSSSTNATAGGNSSVSNGTVSVTATGGGAGLGSGSGVASPGGAGGTGSCVGCTNSTDFSGGSGAVGNNGDDNTGGGGGGGAGNAGNGGTPATTTQDNNATGGAGGIGNPNTAPYVGGTGGGVGAAYYENGNPGTGIGAGGGGGGGEDQFFHGTGYGNGGAGTAGQVIIVYSVSTPTITSVTGGGCVGTTVTINGTLLTGATSATINGTAVTNLTVVSSTQITGTIATGTTTGTVLVTTPCGTATSATPFTVHPTQTVNLGSHTFCTSYTFGGQTYTTGGNYTNTVPSTVTGCDSTTNITLVLASQLTQSIAENICAGSGYSFGGKTYTASGVYKDTAVSVSTGCDSITTLTLTVYPLIQQAVSATICSGTSYTFGTRTLTQSGTYADTVPSTVTGCDSITTLTLTVTQTPNASITPPAATVCPGVNTTLTASAAAQYAWSSGQSTVSITVTPTTTTTYTVTESNGTCTATATATLTVTPFSISINPDTTRSCIAAAVTLTCSYTSTNPNGYTWSTTPATGSSPGLSQGVVVFPVVTTVYTVTVSNGSCTASASAVVLVDTPALVITPAVAGVCTGHDTTITASGSLNYTWSNGSHTAATQVAPTVTTKYYVTGSDAHGCISVDSITVNVGAVPTSTFTVTGTVCAGQNATVTYTGNADSNAVYNWYFDGGTVDSGSAKGPYKVNWATGGVVDTVVLNLTDNGCAALPDTQLVTVKALPSAVAGVPAHFCGGDTDVLGAPATAGYSYLWTPSTGLSSDTAANPNISLTDTGATRLFATYTVTATSNGCSASDTVQVIVLPAPIPKFAHQPGQCLPGNKFTFTPDGSFLPTDSVFWTFGANATPLASNAVTQTVTYAAAQTTAVTLTMSRAGCVSNTYVDSVTVYPEPVAKFSAVNTTGCPGISVCFTDSSVTSGTASYLWSFGDGQTGTAATPCHVYSSAGVYTVSLVASANGCSNTSTDSSYITINVAPVASFTPSATTIQQPQTEITFTNTSVNASSYSWNFGGLGTSTNESPTYSFTQYGSYNVALYALNSFGCTDSAVVPVQILPGQTYFIPNAFTPNGDGKDDDFYIQMQEGVTVIAFTVFDRWGEKVHDGPNPWDGTYKGHVCQPGVYVYFFKLRLVDNLDGIKREGTVTLLR